MSISRLVMEFVASDMVSGAAKRMAREVEQLGEQGKRAAAKFEEMGDRFSKGIKAAGVARTMKESLVDPGLSAAAEMEAALKRLEANIDAGGAADVAKFMALARKDADAIAAATKFDSTGVMRDAITEQIKAGLAPEDVLGPRGGAAAAAYLAQADDTDIATANAAILDLAAKFDLAGEDIARAADMAVRYSGASSASVASLDEGLKYLTGLKSIGIGADDTLALLATLDKQGLKGSTGGTSLNQFLSKMTQADQKVDQLDFYDEAGKFRGVDPMTEQLRAFFGGMTQEKQQLAADKLFGDEGKRVLFALLQQGGDNSLEGVRSAAGRSRGLDERMAILSSGNLATRDALAGTKTSTMATLFQPLLAPVTSMAAQLNDLSASVGRSATENPNIAKGVSGLAGGAVLGAAGLSGLRMLGGLPAGIAAGKAAEEIAGVKPVFVVNWPATMGLGGGLSDAAKQGGAMGALGKAGLLGAALTGGYAIGTAINEGLIKGTRVEEVIQGYAAALQSFWAGGLMEEGDRKRVDGVRDRGLAALGELVGLNVTVNVDQAGHASVVTDGVENVAVAARRTGVP